MTTIAPPWLQPPDGTVRSERGTGTMMFGVPGAFSVDASPIEILRGGGSAPTPEQQRQLDAMLDILDTTRAGREVATYVREHPEIVRVWDDAEYQRTFPGSGASFNPARQQLNLPERVLEQPLRGATTVAHEGQHAADAPNRFGVVLRGVGNVLGSVGDAASAALHLDNPITGMLDGFATRELEFEVSAYRTQAQVAKELGRREYGWNLGQDIDGSVRSDDEIRAALAAESLYTMGSGRRLLLGSSIGLVGVLGTSMGVQALAAKLRPGSFLARHSWPVIAGGAALLGAALLHDRAAYERRVESGSLN